jgi:uncharacterized SAM-binding protein YcdF (DUF218 family)
LNQSNQLNRLIIICCFIVLIALAIIQAPAFLIVSDAPVKSDAVLLFIGNDKGTREKEANELIREGFADYLIIPARNQVKKLNPDGTLVKTDLPVTPNHLKPKTASWLEDTHVEALIARDMMTSLGCKSAILVSSPYHMRRIKMIAEKVFGYNFKARYVPTRHEAFSEGIWIFDSRECRLFLMEYAKIAWFLLYSPFV